MTGRWPHELSADFSGPLDTSFPTLAEFLSSRGYATAGFVANSTYATAETGLHRGFAHYEDHDISPKGVLMVLDAGRADPRSARLSGTSASAIRTNCRTARTRPRFATRSSAGWPISPATGRSSLS